jgi:hypothetical protein
MKTLFNISILILISISVKSQTYPTSEVIEKAEFYLESAVGNELFKFFKLDPDSYYKYITKSGKAKWGNINKGKRTKGRFVSGEGIRFIFDHPEFQYPYISRRILVPLTSDLKLSSEINLERIPDFFLRGKKSDWLNDNYIDEIIAQQNLKKPIKEPIRRLEFDAKSGEYYWIVFNTLYKERCFTDEEILHISPKTGKILKHYEERHYVMHCY